MLRLILGVSGTGKTGRVMAEMKARAAAHRHSILLAPEQFSSSAETMAYRTLGDELGAYAAVYSFTSFAERVLKEYGGVAAKTLTDAARVVAVRRAMDTLGDELTAYRRHRRSTGFCSLCADAIEELKTAGADARTLLDTAAAAGEEGKKLHELGLIFAAYEALIEGSAMDPADRITAAAGRLLPEYLADKAVFIDGFDGFTAPEYRMLKTLLLAEECIVTLCCDTLADPEEGLGLFSPVKKTARRLVRIAREQGVAVAAPHHMQEDFRHRASPVLAAVNVCLAFGTAEADAGPLRGDGGGPDSAPARTQEPFRTDDAPAHTQEPSRTDDAPARTQELSRTDDAPARTREPYRTDDAPAHAGAPGDPQKTPAAGFFVTPAAGIYAECKAVACRIAALVREQGLRSGEIAVICRTLDDYAAPLRYEFALAGVPYFSDENVSPEHTAPAAFFTAALTLLSRGVSTEALLALLKTDLCGFTAGEIAALENYAYTWQLGAADWRAPFTRNPDGFGAAATEETDAELARVEELRARVMAPVEHFLEAARSKTAAGISAQLYYLLEAFGGDEHTQAAAAAFEAAGDVLRARAVYAAWEHVMELLDQMAQLLGEDAVSAQEYAELFALLLRAARLGRVPETQDAVLVTTADRMRLDRPAVCFVLGVGEGHFPRLLGASGLLSHADRELLVKNGLEMPGSYENRTLLEQMFFYRALTAPSHALYVSYVSPEAGGAPLSAAMEPLMQILAPQPDALQPEQYAPTPAAALDLLGASYREDTPAVAALEAALRQEGSAAESLAAMARASGASAFRAQETQTLAKLLGERLTLSPTRVEQYYRCRFSYFLQYVLRIRPRRRAELSPVESGSFIHYILEHVLREAGASFTQLSAEELERLAHAAADDYVAQFMPAAGRRFGYLVERIKQGVTRLLAFLQAEQAQSQFHPAAFEQEIGYGENAVPPLTLRTPDGRTVRVQGKIDRVDVMERDGRTYLRVIDYKTGTKAFSLDEVYCGLNTQMLLYLFTLCGNAPEAYKDPVAAGVLYLAGDPAPQTMGREEAAQPPVYHMDGIVLDDTAVVRGMDRDATGLFVPFAFTKNGQPRASAKLASLEKLGEIKRHIDGLVLEMARGLYAGEIDAAPLRTKAHCPCDVCDYRPVCLHEDGRGETLVAAPKNVFEPGAGVQEAAQVVQQAVQKSAQAAREAVQTAQKSAQAAHDATLPAQKGGKAE